MTLTPLQKRAARKARNGAMVDLNLVSLIDVFTILIFFLLSNSTDVETLPGSAAVHLPESTAQKAPRQTLVVEVGNDAITVDGRKVADVAALANAPDDLIVPLKAALDALAAPPAATGGAAANGGTNAGTSTASLAAAKAVTILGDKAIPYQLLRRVMATCAMSGYVDVSFAVNRKA